MDIKTINSLNIKNIVNTSTNDSIIGFDYNVSGGMALGNVSDIYLSNIYIKNLESSNYEPKKSSDAPATSSINPLPYIMLVVYYNSNNREYINLTGVTRDNLYKAFGYGYPIFCYAYGDNYGWQLLTPYSSDPTNFGSFGINADGSITGIEE